MYPPKVTNDLVISTIRELAGQGAFPSGVKVREALAQRFGSRGGVGRIYQLVAAERARRGSTPLSPIGAGLLEQENRNLREQLQQARQREDAHQTHWSREVAKLRAQVLALEPLVRQAGATGAGNASLSAEVEKAEIRAGQLEVQLRVFGPAAGRGSAADS